MRKSVHDGYDRRREGPARFNDDNSNRRARTVFELMPISVVGPRTRYVRLPPASELPADVLFAVTFGATPVVDSPRSLRVNLEPLVGTGLAEVWYADGDVVTGAHGPIRFASDEHFLVGVVEIDELEHGGLFAATRLAYQAIAEFQATCRFPHLLRTWNYFHAINRGAGDGERYRKFCSGRVAGSAGMERAQYPAATVIGRRDENPALQVYWLAGRQPGIAIENPRQRSAYHYPREYGPVAPTFSRAMLVTPELLMISGTASIVGHASQHAGSVGAQVDEILANLDSLLAAAHSRAPALPEALGPDSLIKAYVRNREDLPMVELKLRTHLPSTPGLILHGDVCRADLLVEFDCLHAAG
jgi:chorismate lyase / 3-hydroxybenzoate synthase